MDINFTPEDLLHYSNHNNWKLNDSDYSNTLARLMESLDQQCFQLSENFNMTQEELVKELIIRALLQGALLGNLW